MIRLRMLLVAALLGLGCSKNAETEAQAASSDLQPRSVESPWVAVRAPDKLTLLEAPAEVVAAPASKGAVTPPFAARVVEVFVQEGARVEKGDAIALVMMPEVVRAAAAYGAAGTRAAALVRRKAQLEALRKDGLAKAGEVAEVDALLAEVSAQQQMALATLKIAGLSPKEAAALSASGGAVKLTSPIAGIVTEIDAPLGESREATGAPLARVVGEGASRVEARFTSDPPEGATFVFVGSAEQTYKLTFVNKAPGTSGRDGTIAAWFDAAERLPMPHGTLGKVRVLPSEKSSLFAVPAAAVALSEGRAVVVTRKANAVVAVKVVASSGVDALVSGELQVGDEVAADAVRALAAERSKAGEEGR